MSPAAKPSSTVADEIFGLIVTDILSGRLRPKDQISERDLVARFGVSRTPIREAIKRLRERGLLGFGPKGTAVVREIDADEIDELYSVRLRLERIAAVLTARNISAREIAQLRKINAQFAEAVAARDLVRMLDVRARFHAVAVGATHNRVLAEMLISLRDRAYMVRHAHWQDWQRARETVDMHKAMVEALSNKDVQGYRRIVEAQIRAALDVYRNRLVADPMDHRDLRLRRLRRRAGSAG